MNNLNGNYDQKQKLQKLRLSNEEIQTVASFNGLSETDLEILRETIFNLSLVVFKIENYGST